jgi:hypothetical protein
VLACDRFPEHLDSTRPKHHDAAVRTTVTLDKDVERLLRDAMHHSRKSFKQTLNDGLRVGLGARPTPRPGVPFVLKARPLGLRTGVDPAGFNKLADDLDVDAFIEKPARPAARGRK